MADNNNNNNNPNAAPQPPKAGPLASSTRMRRVWWLTCGLLVAALLGWALSAWLGSGTAPKPALNASAEDLLRAETAQLELEQIDATRLERYKQLFPEEMLVVPSQVPPLVVPGTGDKQLSRTNLHALQTNTSALAAQVAERQRLRTQCRRARAAAAASGARASSKDLSRLSSAVYDLASTSAVGIPRLIFVGDQSVGKSTIAVVLSHINFAHTAHKMATKCPVEVRVRVDSKTTTLFNREQVPMNELWAKMKAYMDDLDGISFEPVVVELRSPNAVLDIDWIDLPGVPNIHQDEETYKRAMQLVEKYALDEKQDNVVVYVFRTDGDPGNSDGALLALIDSLHERSPTNVLAFGNYANILPQFHAEASAGRVRSWLEQLGGIETYFGGVEVDDEMKRLPNTAFQHELRRRVEHEKRHLPEYFERNIFPQLSGLSDRLSVANVGIQRFMTRGKNSLVRARRNSLIQHDDVLVKEDDRLRAEEQEATSMRQGILNLGSIRTMIKTFSSDIADIAWRTSTRTSDPASGSGVETKVLNSFATVQTPIRQTTLDDLYYNNVTPVVQSHYEALQHLQQMLGPDALYPIPAIEPHNFSAFQHPFAVVDADADAANGSAWWRAPNDNRTAAPNSHSDSDDRDQPQLPIMAQELNWLVELYERADVHPGVVVVGLDLLKQLLLDLWWRVARTPSGPSWELVFVKLTRDVDDITTRSLVELYPSVIQEMHNTLDMKRLLQSISHAEGFVVRETLRMLVHVFLSHPHSAPLHASPKLTKAFNDVLVDIYKARSNLLFTHNTGQWMARLKGKVDPISAQYEATDLRRWPDFDEVNPEQLECINFPHVYVSPDINNDALRNARINQYATLSELRAQHFAGFAACCRVYWRIRLRLFLHDLLDRSKRDFVQLFGNLHDHLANALVPDNVPDMELLERYDMNQVHHALGLRLEAIDKARRELQLTRDELKQAVPVLNAMLEMHLFNEFGHDNDDDDILDRIIEEEDEEDEKEVDGDADGDDDVTSDAFGGKKTAAVKDKAAPPPKTKKSKKNDYSAQ